jgi:hypothetical protein
MAELKLVEKKKVKSVANIKRGDFFVRRGGTFNGSVYIVVRDDEGLYFLIDIATGERWCDPKSKDGLEITVNEVTFDNRSFEKIYNPVITVEGEF